jgi:hypothetical protein
MADGSAPEPTTEPPPPPPAQATGRTTRTTRGRGWIPCTCPTRAGARRLSLTPTWKGSATSPPWRREPCATCLRAACRQLQRPPRARHCVARRGSITSRRRAAPWCEVERVSEEWATGSGRELRGVEGGGGAHTPPLPPPLSPHPHSCCRRQWMRRPLVPGLAACGRHVRCRKQQWVRRKLLLVRRVRVRASEQCRIGAVCRGGVRPVVGSGGGGGL